MPITKKFEMLEHKADLKIRAFGKNKEELFLNMMLGMESGLLPKLKAQISLAGQAKLKTIKIKSLDVPALLVDFLSEVLCQIQINQEIYNSIKFKKFTETEIEAVIFGQKAERFNEDIKAVTYHDLDIHQNKDGTWEAVVLFDI